ncbi:hypothetical protein [Eubacterium oxidoreducens]|uniref:Uncharacterized protein n=1 Tax=Eubacterium oxidoreducens TaxID=1732 RepID=A0A1G6A4W0_EUBOX|nr:hypothetical protein [Eubacterium oxidoreducens]SDB03435.1 hypothetical protein SAMN02910417_00264 [Eubacterium oxidoreducens]
MKTFSIRDCNKPLQFFTGCTGCILTPKKMDQIDVVTASGEVRTIGIQLPHDLSLHIYNRILEAAQCGGTIIIPDMQEMDDDEIRTAVENITIE